MAVFRICAKTGDGKVIVSRTRGEPFFFNFGKSEVGNPLLITYLGCLVHLLCFM